MKEYEALKEEVCKIIKNNKDKEITRKTTNNNSGIYMLYVECFDDEKILPFYIGQTNDFQERHKQHFEEILSLNRLKHSCYKYALFNGLYNGHYRACKIFSYMVNHNCEIKDLHMIVIEEIEDEIERLKKEKDYINELFAPFVGFNQLNYVYYYYKSCDGIAYKEIVDSDIKCMRKYSEYGYNLLNWYLSNEYLEDAQKKELIHGVDNKEYSSILENKKRLKEIKEELAEIERYNCYECYDEAWKICEKDILDYFTNYGLRSKQKQKLVVSVLLYDYEKEKRDLDKYFTRSKKDISLNLIDILTEKYESNICAMKEKIILNQKRYIALKDVENAILEKVLVLLYPTKDYKSCPLKSLYEDFQFPKFDVKSNICYINIEYTCFKSDYYENFYPEICKIDYLIYKEGQTYSKKVFVKTELNQFWETDKIYYYEKGFSSGPFHIYLVGNVGTHIPVSMEYRNGINEYTLKNVNMDDEVEVFEEIDALIDEKTKIIYTTSGYKSAIKRYSYIAEKKNITILKRLIRMCK